MHSRRTLLRAGGVVALAGLAGCTGSGGPGIPSDTPGSADDDPADDDPADDGTDTAPSDRARPADATHEATVASVDDAPDLPVAPRVSLADPYVTEGSPVVLRVDVENTTDAAVTIGEYRNVVFQYTYAEDAALVWLPHSDRSTDGEPDRATPELELADAGCWRLDSQPVQTAEYGTVEIPAGGTLTAFVGLYALPDAPVDGSCFPTGEFRFEARYAAYDDGTIGDPEASADWGFDLAIEAIDGGR
ncbi:hypothetical protein Hbl1158_15705 (plasmid) [Halobaculum sp. CBA1158]|uniref:hypothetical protein n=1 Tax=Halobaculum sp. CBA1158 TaxID=2904243 RepID=UPI001F433069|nr:hypothetical protein [Halobaculum sp. CBA1158]UIP01356.1 hypothetical protein Hbl1158_15705 [Halobaculum sp. CBA1158]